MRFRRWVVFTFAIHLAVIVVDKGAGFVLYWITQDDPQVKGAADLLTTLPFILMAVANLGLATSLVYHVRRGLHAVQEVAETTSAVALFWGGGLALVAFPLSLLVAPMVFDTEMNLWLLGPLCLCVPFLLLSSYFNSVQLATGRIRDYNLLHLVGSVAFLPLFLLFYWLTGHAVTAGIVFARLATAVLLAGLVVFMLRGVVRLRPRLHAGFLRDGVTYGWRANITSVLTYLNLRLNLFVVPVLFVVPATAASEADGLRLEQVAFYGLALSFAELVWHFPEATRDLFFSRLAGSSHEEASRLTPVLCRLCVTVAVVGGVAIYFLVDPLMPLISRGDNWGIHWSEQVHSALGFLLPGTIAFTVAKIVQNDLAARGHLNECIGACATVTMVMLPLDVMLIPAHGATGAAIALLAGYLASTAFTLVAYRRRAGISPLRCLLLRASDLTYGREIMAAVWAKIHRR